MFQCIWQKALENANNALDGIFYNKFYALKYKNLLW